MEYSLKVESAPKQPAGAPRELVSMNPHLSFEELIYKVVAYSAIWHVQVPTPQYIAGLLLAAWDEDLGFGEIALSVDLGMFSDKMHVLTILQYD